MKKILLIHHGKGIGGAPRSMLEIAKKLKNDTYNVHILFLHKSDVVDLFKEFNVDVVKLPLKYFNHSSRWYKITELHIVLLQLISWIATVLFVAPYWYRKLKPDVVYLNSSVLTDWSFSAKLHDIKNIVHVRESISKGYFGFRNKLIKNLLNYSANTIIFLSKHNLNQLNTNSFKSIIVHNYVTSITNYDLICKDKVYDFIYVGGLQQIKGIELITKFIAFNTHYKICLLGYYSKEFIHKNKNKNIDIIGPVSNPLDYISKSKILLFPATTPHFPRPVIEALSCGTIPIVSNLPGIDEIIEDKVNGLMFEKDDLNSLLNTIEVLEKSNQEMLVQNGLQICKSKFSDKNEYLIINAIEDELFETVS